MRTVRYRIPKGICHRDCKAWQGDAERAGIDFERTPKPLYYRDFDSGEYVVMQDVDDTADNAD